MITIDHGQAVAAVGIGCRLAVSPESIVSLVQSALAAANIPRERATLCTLDRKKDDVALAAAATRLGMRVIFMPPETLAAITTPTWSDRVEALVGVASVAESAALAGAGANARLIIPRIARDGVTCAVAVGSV